MHTRARVHVPGVAAACAYECVFLLMGACLLPQRDPSFIATITNPAERRIFDFDYPDNADIRARRDKLRCGHV